MKKILAYSSMFLVVMMAALSVSAAPPADFSGIWTLDTAKSTAQQGGGGGGTGTVTLTVKQDAKTLTSTRKTERGEQTSIYNLVDGSESINKITGRMEGTATSKVKWQSDGKILEINTETKASMQGNEFTMTAVAHWELMEGGKVLKIHSKTTTPQGERVATMFYNKQ